ncbi:MAG: glutathione S-transferase N-terminal domain-containing protein [Polyangiaceae bacterium]|nr:glutathione S-transferase N-terminal domain-containing protein [Myxococcales bacterium]MCB9584957.1 glutathione S-transferase N-terminal domain-containing protein [Polyangiaceae bacterium]MCB9607470.1 glutathione S-transferase N-terminal domain-containing protein [Polyangiaceae bacterium]
MKLYFSPLACSMATRIALYEAGVEAEFVEVDARAKRTLKEDGDYLQVNPLGLVPVLEEDDGRLLKENMAVLQRVARLDSGKHLAPTGDDAQAELQQWLSFVSTELHKGVFSLLFDRKAAPEVKAYALGKAESRLDYLAGYLEGREFLLSDFSVADAYLVTVLNWFAATPVDLGRWPALKAYFSRLRQRPSVSKAMGEERVLYGDYLRKYDELTPQMAQVLGVA